MYLIQKKGDSKNLYGRITVYAQINPDADTTGVPRQILDAISNGIIAAQGDYRKARNLTQFLKEELGLSFEAGIEELIKQAGDSGGIESAIDPALLKDRLKNMKKMEDFIPTPAKIVLFDNEENLMQEEGDIFYVGSFNNAGNANLAVNALPILYQAQFKEQHQNHIMKEINSLLMQAEESALSRDNFRQHSEDLAKTILSEYIPKLVYSAQTGVGFEEAADNFRDFMGGYKYMDDIEKIIEYSRDMSSSKNEMLAELYTRKADAFLKEDFAKVQEIINNIEEIEN
ncbi:MAG: hypothetical protein ACLFQK_06845 [Fibrobacterota bacterium]